MDYIINTLLNIGFLDLYILIILVIGTLLVSFTFKLERAIYSILAAYCSYAIASNAPLLKIENVNLSGTQIPVDKLIVFIILFSFLVFFFSQARMFRISKRKKTSILSIKTILSSLVQVGFLLSISLSLTSTEITKNLTQLVKDIFMSDLGLTLWMILPIFVVVSAPKRRKKYSSETEAV